MQDKEGFWTRQGYVCLNSVIQILRASGLGRREASDNRRHSCLCFHWPLYLGQALLMLNFSQVNLPFPYNSPCLPLLSTFCEHLPNISMVGTVAKTIQMTEFSPSRSDAWGVTCVHRDFHSEVSSWPAVVLESLIVLK